MLNDPVVIVGAARTPIGAFQGVLSSMSATDLGAVAVKAAVKRACAGSADIDEVLMGCVLSAGLGQAPARQVALKAGLSNETSCTLVNKMCASGMKSVMLAHDQLLTRETGVFVAGGFESMSNAPYLLPKARSGYRMGHREVKDHMFFDGLEDAYETGTLMGVFADQTAADYNISRAQQDDFAIASVERAQQAQREGLFNAEIASVQVKTRQTTCEISEDEGPQIADIEKITQLKPAFSESGTVTAANASSISDGAAATVLMRQSQANRRGFSAVVKIIGHSMHAQEPSKFTTAPVTAIKVLLQKLDWSVNQVDLFEINEAFAVVTMVVMKALDIPHEKVNINGGACVLGHPIGATGARIIVTLINNLIQRDAKRGIAALCIGGGEATAIAIERV